MNGKRIKIMLMERDISQAQIARELGVTRTAVNGTIFDVPNKRSFRIKRHIAKLLGKSVSELWQSKHSPKDKKE